MPGQMEEVAEEDSEGKAGGPRLHSLPKDVGEHQMVWAVTAAYVLPPPTHTHAHAHPQPTPPHNHPKHLLHWLTCFRISFILQDHSCKAPPPLHVEAEPSGELADEADNEASAEANNEDDKTFGETSAAAAQAAQHSGQSQVSTDTAGSTSKRAVTGPVLLDCLRHKFEQGQRTWTKPEVSTPFASLP